MDHYHETSKHHHPHGYAAGPGYTDWENQPDSFRTYHPVTRVALPLMADGMRTGYEELFVPGSIQPLPLDRHGLGGLLELSLAISAWKEYLGERWSLRCHPASGNLHPMEGYLVVPTLAGLAGGIYHYNAMEHCLERRFIPADGAAWDRCFAPGEFFLGLSMIPWRVTWRYGVRSWRYCNLDAGHALAAVGYGAAALGWRARLLSYVADGCLENLLGLRAPAFDAMGRGMGEAEREEPVMLVGIACLPQEEKWQVEPLVQLAKQGSWQGYPNRLTPGEWRSWPLVEEAISKSRKPATLRYARERPAGPPLLMRGESPLASRLIRQRRSGQSYDGRATLGWEGFLRIMDRALVRNRVVPWDLLPWRAQVHMVVLVHRCEGMASGVYLLARDGEGLQRFRHQSNPVFSWSIPAGTPDSIPLYTLLVGDCRKLAASSACHQEMAADGVFTVAMVVDMKGALQQGGWNYRALHWEAGVLGQMLYLEAEAEGLNGTGIGCFFDDLLTERLGLSGQGWQVIYQFTVGRALVDNRLTTLPAYTLPVD